MPLPKVSQLLRLKQCSSVGPTDSCGEESSSQGRSSTAAPFYASPRSSTRVAFETVFQCWSDSTDIRVDHRHIPFSMPLPDISQLLPLKQCSSVGLTDSCGAVSSSQSRSLIAVLFYASPKSFTTFAFEAVFQCWTDRQLWRGIVLSGWIIDRYPFLCLSQTFHNGCL